MVGSGFKVFSLIFSILGLALAILSIYAVHIYNAGIDDSAPFIVKALVLVARYEYILVGIVLFVTNLLTFILVVRGDIIGVIRRWYFIPALIGSLISIASVVGIIYFIIVLVALFKSEVTPYEENDARKYIIVTSIIFISLGIAGLIIPMVLSFEPSLMSLVMFFGMCFTCFSFSAVMYFLCGPDSRFNLFVKIVTFILVLASLTGLYFLFRVILSNNVERFDGDWSTIHNAIIAAVSVAALMDISYFVFGLVGNEYDAYVNMQQSSIAIALIVLIVANFVSLFWWLIIEAILWILSFVFIMVVTAFFASAGGGGGGGGGSETVTTYEIDGKEAEDIGGGRYRDSSGDVWVSVGGDEVERED